MPRYRIDQVKLDLDERASNLEAKIIKKLGRKYGNIPIRNIEILKRSIDARGDRVSWVYSIAFDIDAKLKLPIYIKEEYIIPSINKPLADDDHCRPLVVGFGPCGMFCALVLAEAGLRPIVLERGGDVDSRAAKVETFWKAGELDPECNVQFGEGGAGTFSDGKLNTGIKDQRIRFVLETLAEAGADGDILIDARPHIGTDRLKTVVKNIRKRIIELGGEIRFDCRVDELILEEKDGEPGIGGLRYADKKRGICASESGSHVVLALGHSARDTLRGLYEQGIRMEGKPFSMGVRVEHNQKIIDRGMYGDDAGHPSLPPAYYKLSYRAGDDRGVYSFCMCPGGEIVNAASQSGGVVTNGMSNSKRDSGRANSGILVDVRVDDFSNPEDPLSGVEFQEKYERLAFIAGGGNYTLPETKLKGFLAAVDSLHKACDHAPDGIGESLGTGNPVVDALPDFAAKDIAEAMAFFGKRIPGFDDDDVRVVGIESRSSSPVRMIRDRENLAAMSKGGAPIRGLYPGGEGAGYAGGITSAACDGIKIAEKIIADIINLSEEPQT